MRQGYIEVLCNITANFGEFEILSELFFIDSDQRGAERGKQGKDRERSSRGTCVKGSWAETTGGRLESGRLGMGRAGESDGGREWGQL